MRGISIDEDWPKNSNGDGLGLNGFNFNFLRLVEKWTIFPFQKPRGNAAGDMPTQLGTSAQSVRLCQAHTETQPNRLEHEQRARGWAVKTQNRPKHIVEEKNGQGFNVNGKKMNWIVASNHV